MLWKLLSAVVLFSFVIVSNVEGCEEQCPIIEVYCTTMTEPVQNIVQPRIFGTYELHTSYFINNRGYFKNEEGFGIWWDGEDSWRISSSDNMGQPIGYAKSATDVDCPEETLNWHVLTTGYRARWMDTYDEFAFGIRCYDPEAMNYEESQCTAEPEVDCEWQEWSECSKSCGIGTRIRYKNWMCQGDLDEVDLCNMDPCPDQ